MAIVSSATQGLECALTEISPELILKLRNDIRSCTACELRKTATSPVPWRGPLHPDILVIGEAPGQTEDRDGEPFVGSSGALLQTKLREAGLLAVATIAYANSCQCFPNRGLSATQDVSYIDTCRKWMRMQVALLQPQFILTVGTVAFRSVWGNLTWPSLLQVHGKPMYWDDAPVPAQPSAVFCSYHPSAALRSGKNKRILLADLMAMKQWVDSGERWPDQDCYLCGQEATRWDTDGRGIPLCERHSQRQLTLAGIAP